MVSSRPAYPARSERFTVTTDWPHGTGVQSISRSSSALPWRLLSQPAQRRFHQRCGVLEPPVLLAVPQQLREQVPGQPGRRAQPVPLVVIAEQHLRHGQAYQLRVGDLRRPARAAARKPAAEMMRSVSTT
jgi:hypothetical protein